jgi:hypothetical protein
MPDSIWPSAILLRDLDRRLEAGAAGLLDVDGRRLGASFEPSTDSRTRLKSRSA